MRRTIALLSLAAALLAAPRLADAKVKVVATVPDLAALARDVGGPDVEVVALALPTQDPHFVDPKPSLALHLSKADLLIAVGLDLEVGWLPTLQVGARNPKIQVGAKGYLDCSTAVGVLETPTQKVDRSQGDIHPGGSPHYLYDPRRANLVAAAITERLMAIDPDHAEAYRKRYRAFAARLETARQGWEEKLAPYRGVAIVTYHKSWAYLADWLGFRVVAQLEPKPGIPPTSKHVAQVLGFGRKQGVKVIIQEDYYPDQTSSLLAQKMPARLVKLSGGAGADEGYIEHMEHWVEKLEAELRAAAVQK
jgi:zinc/manganese transport system substrate-binding protein